MKILILCTGNSCRSQMAEGFLKAMHPSLTVHSAGTKPENTVSPFAVEVMREAGIDISGQFPKSVSMFQDEDFDYVITVCDHAKESCPVFSGKVKNRIHAGFADPADARGQREEILEVYRKVRDQIQSYFQQFYKEHLSSKRS